VVTTLEALDEDSLVKFLTEPKNSILKRISGCSSWTILRWSSSGCLYAVAQKAMSEKPGPGGCAPSGRKCLATSMFDAPSDYTISKVIITKGCVEGVEPYRVEHVRPASPAGSSFLPKILRPINGETPRKNANDVCCMRTSSFYSPVHNDDTFLKHLLLKNIRFFYKFSNTYRLNMYVVFQ
jgi:hypothetical protein